MKTIKQIADELGVEKHKIEYQARHIDETCKTKIDGAVRISEAGEQLIIENLKNPRRKGKKKGAENGAYSVPKSAGAELSILNKHLLSTELKTVFSLMEENNKLLQNQLEEKDKQIAELLKIINSKKKWQFWKKGVSAL